MMDKPFDPYPFTFLTLILSVLAIYMTSFVLITQKREAELESRRASLDLQVNLLSEQENTKIIELLDCIAQKVGAVTTDDSEAPNIIEELSDAIESCEEDEKNPNP
jgi:uncharacterized membrane protein